MLAFTDHNTNFLISTVVTSVATLHSITSCFPVTFYYKQKKLKPVITDKRSA